MLNSRRSPKRSDAFRSRFRDGAGDFPLRRYLRCREDMFSGIVHSVLLVAFLVALALFARSLWQVFARHGADVNPWYGRGAMALMAIFWLLVLRRLWRKVAEVREARREMLVLQAELERHRRGDAA